MLGDVWSDMIFDSLRSAAILDLVAAASVLTSSRRHFRRTLHADAGSRPVGPQ
ncbi:MULTISPECIES: hypothetical protein [unclassified Cryobacterium]|uniref:hypothetical protein n=1 Tax=unclassified Cryobacterium TaxID=2649013 RepID=UPI001304BB41|nr:MULTISPECIES: hypothetical protein [unclassified Cryobacterium]